MSSLAVTVLGSASPYPRPDNPCSGYLVSTANTRLWVDAGTGTLAELQRHTRLTDLDGIWLSHLHADHCADLLTAYYALLYADVRLDAPIPLFGPPGSTDRLAGFLTNGPTRSPVESAFAVTELTDGHHAEVGGLTLTTRAVDHGMPAFALRVRSGDRSLVYSGDTAPCAALTTLAQGCDVLLCEADSATASTDEPPVHHTPEEAGQTAAKAGVGKLIVTHLSPFLTPPEAVTRAAAHYPGRVDHAAPGEVFRMA
ncbi:MULTISPECIES: MBL fold metallo-hydrolase [Actinoalloteichus]|uniref:Metal-dependent hydrolase, beta-lactamase superfamily III n=1 Tax=Actinoalloteichus fjordicus TaxID=1612552 RepID=A0AAC9LGU1_9PSEU|nr:MULTISPECIES: MBL fold metallo-hydrolase [Actinoalloteichus]APU16614.1 metal-dependent hydrolase, beta-lactamase superfamily III [Actinoalloteichus fjordicus]APU22680.1 metal-dependent hydrolase, beta-lactamase superfamily III [Actinoalloteichus sp. GBA129-24]